MLFSVGIAIKNRRPEKMFSYNFTALYLFLSRSEVRFQPIPFLIMIATGHDSEYALDDRRDDDTGRKPAHVRDSVFQDDCAD